MMRILLKALLCLLWVVCLFPLQAQVQSTEHYSRAQIHITPENAGKLHLMEIDLTHGKFVPGRFFITDLTSTEIAHIRSVGFDVDILIDDVKAHYKSASTERSPLTCQEFDYDYRIPENFELGSVGGYLAYSEILDALDLMQILYPDLISSRQSTGDEVTHQGRSIFWVRISDNAENDEPEPEVLYTALHHAREPMSMMQMIYYMWYLLEGYGKDPEATYLLNNTELYFMPCVNPDGYLYNQITDPDGGGMWRKNMRDNNNDGTFDPKDDGVDLNRNYSHEWGADEEGSSGNPPSQVYRGPFAFSEPETRAVKEFTEAHDILLALNYHAYGNFFLYPWGYTEEENPDIHIFENYGELMALDNGYEHGTSMETVGYPTNGCSDDWMFAEHGIHAMTPEIGDDDHGFWPDHTQIIPMCQASLKNNLALAHLPHQFAIARDINGDFFTSREGALDVQIKSYGGEYGDMALTMVSLSPELEIDGSIIEVSIDRFEEQSHAIGYQIDAAAQGGEELTFVLQLDNGFFELRDTITKTIAGETLVFYEDGADLSEWTGDWGVTTESSFAGGSCLTDSPNATYDPNADLSMMITEPIDLTNAIHAVMEFWMKWEIEEYIDFAQVQISTDGVTFNELCGKQSKPGSIFQLSGPVYDGIQEEWVKESIDLSAYIGTQVYIRFILYSDSFLSLDGIYLDEIRVFVYDQGPSATVDTENGAFKAWPNPVSDHLYVATPSSSTTQPRVISITNAVGAEVERRVLNNTAETLSISTMSWPSGLYLINVYGDNAKTGIFKVIVE